MNKSIVIAFVISLTLLGCDTMKSGKVDPCPIKIQAKTIIGKGKTVYVTKCDSTERTLYNSSDQVIQVSNWYKGKPNGSFISYWGNGNIKQTSYWKNGSEHGTTKIYYDNGNIEQISNWENGSQVGTTIFYYRDGSIEQEYESEKGKHHGPFKEYHPNGNLKCEGSFRNGERYGNWYYYFEDGTKEKTEIYKGGIVVDTLYKE